MKCKPLFSFIVPVYNVEQYLPVCVDSILDQEYSNFEVILVDDGSPDNCPNICDLYAKKDSRIFVVHKQNGGLSDARNAGILKASGDYLIFLDSDDYIISKQNLTVIADEIEESKKNLYFLNNIISDEQKLKGKERALFQYEKTSVFMSNAIRSKYKYICSWAWIIKKDFLIEENLFFYKGILHEDEEWFVRILQVLNKQKILPIFNGYFYFYRLNREGAITYNYKEKNIKDLLFVLKETIEFSEANDSRFIKKILKTRAAQFESGFFLDKNKSHLVLKNETLLKDALQNRKVLLESVLLKHKILFFVLLIKYGL